MCCCLKCRRIHVVWDACRWIVMVRLGKNAGDMRISPRLMADRWSFHTVDTVHIQCY